MDTVYGTKKYFQSLSGGSDIYRTSASRGMGNDYSYHNTLGRRSTVAPYTHMGKMPSYSTDMSLSSQYGYNSWGFWRDARNISPSVYSSKSRSHSTRSYSIILTTAAFIVLLIVLCIGGLAFYYTTFKSSMDDPIMGFEGSFHVIKGDLYTTGLKYTHTSVFKLKADYYKRFVERSLLDSGLFPTKTEITGFGDGPLIHVHFRTLLDVRKMPENIHSVEAHISNSFISEVESAISLYKSLRIEPHSIEVKRVLDEDYIKSDSFIRDSGVPVSQTHFEERINAGKIEKAQSKILPKTTTTAKPKFKEVDNEPEVDVENAPVIQGSFEGSFEMTKADADLSGRRTSPSRTFPSTAQTHLATATPMRIKTKKTTIEKIQPPTKIYITPTPSTVVQTTTSTTTTEKPSTVQEPETVEVLQEKHSENTSVTEAPPPETTKETGSPAAPVASTTADEHAKYSNVHDPPKLDVALFTSAPVLDTEPWRPIRPGGASAIKEIPSPDTLADLAAYSQPPRINFDPVESGLLPRNKIAFAEQGTENPNEMIFYHSFTNPVFMPSAVDIERLGSTEVKPHPLPVPLIDEVVMPPASSPTPTRETKPEEEYEGHVEGGEFEHIGGGVVVKHHNTEDVSKPSLATTKTESESSPIEPINGPPPQKTANEEEPVNDGIPEQQTTNNTNSNEELIDLSEELGGLLHSLLDIPSDQNDTEPQQIQSRINDEDEIKSNISFLNIKEHVLRQNKTKQPITTKPTPSKTTSLNASLPLEVYDTTPKPSIPVSTTTTPLPMTTNQTKPPSTTRTTPATIDQSMLFPSHSKWEFVNGSTAIRSTPSANMRKIFNDTLQAWVVENNERRDPAPGSAQGVNVKKNNTDDIQDISLIFDTLASKLGISPSIPTKVPPFIAFNQNKRKQSLANRTETTRRTAPRTTTPTPTKPVTRKATTPSTTPVELFTEEPILLQPLEEEPILGNSSPEIIVGEAEVEVVDPTKYEEMLSSQAPGASTARPPSLVTLLPVRSNSGIRTFKPITTSSESRNFGQIPRYREAVVKTGIHVTS